jgi:tRNA-dihydrouridine synthase
MAVPITSLLSIFASMLVQGLDKSILSSITENSTGRPIFAQLIGESIPDLVRIALELSRYPIAGIDLNMGCPAPRIYRKNVGGGLLRDPEKVSRIPWRVTRGC